MSEFIEIVSKSAFDDIEKLDAGLVKLLKDIKSINEEAKNFKLPSQATNVIKKSNAAKQQANALDKEAQRLAAALERQKAKLHHAQGKVNQELIKYRYETQQANREAKQQAIISSRLSTEYQKQQARISLLSNRYRDLATKQELGVKLSKKEEKELKDVTRQIERKQRALKKVDANMGVFNRNVGNYKSAWKGIGGVLKASLAAFGAFAAIDIAKQIFSQIKEINSLNAALKNVTETTYGFNQAQSFLSDVAYETGVSINELQRSYTKFYASAKNTNLTLQETQNIFRQTAKAGAVLGLSTDQVNGALTALEQMLSKGKVQAEEIRGQLGERLPGAFQILAKSMGVTTSQLNKMLEDGQVIADEVLPKFAEQLEKTFGLDKVAKVETLVAEQGRLTNAWREFVSNVDSGDGIISNVLKGIFQTITAITNGLAMASKSFKEITEDAKQSGLANAISDDLKEVDVIAKSLVKSFEEQGKALSMNEAKIKAANLLIEQYTTRSNKILDSLSIWNEEERDKNFVFKEQRAALLKLIESIKNKGKADEENNKKGKEQKVLIQGTIAWYEDLIKQLKVLQNEVDLTSEAWADHQRRIDTLQMGIDKLKGTLEDWPTMDAEELLPASTALQDLQELNRGLQTEMDRQLQQEKDFQDKKVALIRESTQRIADLYGMDASKFEFLYNNKIATVEDYAEASAEILKGVNNAIFQSTIANIDKEISANREKYDHLIAQAEGNERQQELLRQEAARKERQLLEKQARAEKNAAVFDSVINTATAVVKALPNLPLAALVGGLGAAQTALIAAQPLPQYKTGRKGGKEEYAILGDGYKHEPIIDKHGNLKDISPNKPTVMHLDKGDSVLPSMQDLMRSSVMATVESAKGKDPNKAFEAKLSQLLNNSNKSIIKSLRKANFVNNNNVNVDLGFEMKKQKYS